MARGPNGRRMRSRTVRGQRVLLENDVARLLGVQRRTVVSSVKAQRRRFPEDFAFALTSDELAQLNQVGKKNNPDGGDTKRRRPQYAFSAAGVLMLAHLLPSKRARGISIEAVRACVRNWQLSALVIDLFQRLETRDGDVTALLQALKDLC